MDDFAVPLSLRFERYLAAEMTLTGSDMSEVVIMEYVKKDLSAQQYFSTVPHWP